jgi:cytochrome b
VVAWLYVGEASIHEGAGFIVLLLLLFRLIWGMMGPESARFSNFLRMPGDVFRYLVSIVKGNASRYLGHNPAGGAMVLALLLSLGVLVVSGVLMRTTVLWGNEFVEQIHGGSANLTLLLIVGHLIGVILASLQHKEILPLSMVTGIKPDTGEAEPFLGGGPPGMRGLLGSIAVGCFLAGLLWGAHVVLNASLWRLPRMITAAAKEQQCPEIKISDAVLEVYPRVQVVYRLNERTRLEVPLAKFMVKKPQLDLSSVGKACASVAQPADKVSVTAAN